MRIFRVFTAFVFVALLAYTAVTITNHGWNLLPVFFGDMKAMAWPGQFNFDFMFMLAFSGLWVAWRETFAPKGIALGIVAFFGGALFLSAYLFVEIGKSKDTRSLLLGKNI